MRQNVPLRKPASADTGSDNASRSIDEWLDAAIAEQSRRTGPGDLTEAAAPAGAGSASSPGPEAAAPPRLPPAAAARSSTALNSMTSWLERAQEELADAGRGATGDGAQPTSRGLSYDALGAVERVDTGFGSDKTRSEAQAAQEEAFRNLENRIREIAGRLEKPRPASGRPTLRSLDEAIIEIRARQAALDGQEKVTAPPPAPTMSTEIAEAPVAQEAFAAPPAPRAEADARPDPSARAAEPALPAGLEGIRRDIDRVHHSLGELARQSDLAALELSIATLSAEIAETRNGSGDVAPAAAQIEALQAEIQRLSSAPGMAPEGIDKLARDIDIVSHKLDIVAASGIDPSTLEDLSNEVGEVKALLGGMAARGDIGHLNEQLSEMKLELARIGSRQVDSQDFASLRTAFEDMRDALSAGTATPGPSLTAAGVQQATRDELQPIASMLVMLIEKIERLERHSGDPEMAVQLERQIAGLSATIGSTAARDPALSDLSHAMTDLMNEVATWRTGTVQIAEQAARTAVAETIEAIRSEFGPSKAWPMAGDTTAAVAFAFPAAEWPRQEEEGRRDPPQPAQETGGTEVLDTQEAAPAGSPEPALAMSDAELRRLNEALLAGPMLTEADRPVPRAPQEEVLLEPGAGRPHATSELAAEADPAVDQRDIKASFIAAARRAAQAAAADADRNKARPSERKASSDPDKSSAKLRGMLDRLRRPLLVSAAALVVAIGSYRLVTELTSEQGNQAFAERTPNGGASAPIIGAPAFDKVAAAQNPDLADPTTTASVPTAALNGSAALQGAKSFPVATGMPDSQPAFSAPAAAEAPPQKQTSQLPPASAGVPLPPRPAVEPGATLREAALNGDPAALYELAVRTLEGRGVARDPRAAVSLFEKAGEKNLPIAQYRAGNAYEKGIGVSRDVEAARRWYQRAAENGNTRAMHNLAVLMAEGAAGRPDYGSAMTWFQKAADHGVRDSQFNLAVLFARGLGTQQDLVRSYTWFAVAAGQGDEEAARKRDEVAARLQPADLARAKSAVERWRVAPPNTLANEAPAPAAKWSQAAMRRSAKA
ncbi:MAG: hypothetical protein JWQ36_971 [Enterovirga sp.]|nr:hypothetical protein [Enterovirga sp.]